MQTKMTEAELNINIQSDQGKADYQRSIQQAQQIRALAEAESEKIARIGIAQALATEEQVRAYGGPQFQVTQTVMQRFADAIQQSGVDIVPRVLIKGGGGADGDNSTGSVIEGLMAMLLSEKLGVNVTDQSAARSPEADALRQQIRESMSKPVATEAPKPDAKKK
jgi:2',3'-cyclic-nucleotide 2'-phosphodiesterase (5'-nucleotidase family)